MSGGLKSVKKRESRLAKEKRIKTALKVATFGTGFLGLPTGTGLILNLGSAAIQDPEIQNKVLNKTRILVRAINKINPNSVKNELLTIAYQDIENISYFLNDLEKKLNRKIVSGQELDIVQSLRTELIKIRDILQNEINEFNQIRVSDPRFQIKAESLKSVLENTDARLIVIEMELTRIIDSLEEMIQQKESYPKEFKLNIVAKPNVEATVFVGSEPLIFIGMLQMLKRFSSACILVSKEENINDFGFVSWECSGIYNRKRVLRFPEGTTETFTNCINNKNVRFILIPLLLREAVACEKTVKNPLSSMSKLNHANLMLYDKQTNMLERFEPYGGSFNSADDYDTDKIDSVLKQSIDNLSDVLLSNGIITDKIQYVSPFLICPERGHQKIQEGESQQIPSDPAGFCAAWSIWYANLRLANPNISREKVMQMSIDTLRNSKKVKATIFQGIIGFETEVPKVSFTQFIRNYSDAIIREAERLFKPLGYEDVSNAFFSDDRVVEVLKREFKRITNV